MAATRFDQTSLDRKRWTNELRRLTVLQRSESQTSRSSAETDSAERKPHSGFLTDNRQGAGIAKSSFRSCFPELCEGRQVIFLDCTLVRADPGDDGELRGHTGRHWRNVEKFVAHPSFAELNEGLKDIDPEANILVVCFCNQGRHRSVAEKEVLYDLFKRKWFGSRRGTITQIDLQRKQWKLCPPDCEDCNCKSQSLQEMQSIGG